MSKIILREIGKIYRALNSFSDSILKLHNLEKGQYQYLLRIKESPGINQQNLSSILLVDKTTTAKSVNKLVNKGYVTKKIAVVDKRNFNLYATEKGKELCDFLDKEEAFVTQISLEGLDLKEQEALLKLLKKITANVTPLYNESKKNKKEYFINLINKENEY